MKNKKKYEAKMKEYESKLEEEKSDEGKNTTIKFNQKRLQKSLFSSQYY